MEFKERLRQRLIAAAGDYHTDNYDHYSFSPEIPFKKKLINTGKRLLYTRPVFKTIFANDALFQRFLKTAGVGPYMDRLQFFYEVLADDASRDLLVDVVAFRALDYVKVKLPMNTPEYWAGIKKMEALRDESKVIDLAYRPYKLYYHDLESFGYPIKVYLHSIALFTTIGMEHYRHEIAGGGHIGADPGDIVVDLGGCYGDTGLYFAHKAGPTGKAYVFEFIPKNISIINQNLDLNPDLKDQVEIVPHPVWESSDLAVYFKDQGANSRVSMEPFEGQEGETKTLSVDGFVERYGLEKVDFIKTDIEGAEPWAIRGAVETLKRFRPKLAVSIYHGMGDFTGLVKQLHDLDLGYKFYLGHATIHAGETVLFCQP